MCRMEPCGAGPPAAKIAFTSVLREMSPRSHSGCAYCRRNCVDADLCELVGILHETTSAHAQLLMAWPDLINSGAARTLLANRLPAVVEILSSRVVPSQSCLASD